MQEHVCYSCFQNLGNTFGPCPYCGYDPAQDSGKFPLALPYGTVLNGRYISGRVLGQGGFGITYAAQDYQTRQLVAIKEYFPEAMATRTVSHSVSAFSGQIQDSFRYGKECFLEEAKTLAEFIGNPNIVRVHSYFDENDTAYFVMDYVRGVSLQSYVRSRGGRIGWQEAMHLLLPIMDALEAVHSKGIIHRDVTPDNIVVTDDGGVKLLDFGAARYSLGDRSRSLDIVLKHGFAPKEQYTRHGRQGPYTDVYSMAATIYTVTTGRLLPDSIDRIDEDDLVLPSSLGVSIPPMAEEALVMALAVRPSDRFQSMRAFREALTAAGGVGNIQGQQPARQAPPAQQQTPVRQMPPVQQQMPPVQQPMRQAQPLQQMPPMRQPQAPGKKTPKWLIPVISAAAVVLIVAVVLIALRSRGTSYSPGNSPGNTASGTSSSTSAAAVSDAGSTPTSAPAATIRPTKEPVTMPVTGTDLWPVAGPTSAPSTAQESEPFHFYSVDGSELDGYRQIWFAGAIASSEIYDHGILYAATNAIDGDLTTSWQEDADDDGYGEYLTLYYDGPETLEAFCFYMGFHPRDYYALNGRPKRLKIEFSDGTSAECWFEDVNQAQYIMLSEPVTTSYVKFTLLEVYTGSKWSDTAITEVSAFRST